MRQCNHMPCTPMRGNITHQNNISVFLTNTKMYNRTRRCVLQLDFLADGGNRIPGILACFAVKCLYKHITDMQFSVFPCFGIRNQITVLHATREVLTHGKTQFSVFIGNDIKFREKCAVICNGYISDCNVLAFINDERLNASVQKKCCTAKVENHIFQIFQKKCGIKLSVVMRNQREIYPVCQAAGIGQMYVHNIARKGITGITAKRHSGF